MKSLKSALRYSARIFGYKFTRIGSQLGQGHNEDAFSAIAQLCESVAPLVIFDVGAHHGLTALQFRSCFPGAHIYCFEPCPRSFQHLVANTSKDPMIYCYEIGLSSSSSSQAFHLNSSSATNSLLSVDSRGSYVWGEGLLETYQIIQAGFRTLDDVVSEISIDNIGILKIDVQGAEHLVLEGAKMMCGMSRIDLVYSEIIIQPTYNGQLRFDKALAQFYELGFDLYNLYNPFFAPDGTLAQVDAIFTRNGFNKCRSE